MEAALLNVRSAPFQLNLLSTGAFSGGRTVWAGVAITPGLAELHAVVGRAVGEAGFRTERREFVPHVTVGKGGTRGVEGFLKEGERFFTDSFLVEGFAVYESVGKGREPVYEVRKRFSLVE